MSYAATINYFLATQWYASGGVQPLSSRFVPTDKEQAAARRGTVIDVMERTGYDAASICRANETSCDV